MTPAIVESLLALSKEDDRISKTPNKNMVRGRIDKYSLETVVSQSFIFLATVTKLPFCYRLIEENYRLLFDKILLPVISDDLDILKELE